MMFIAFEGAPRGLDPVRLQKGLFLFAQEARTVPVAQRYVFKPYSYGPMSRGIYADLDRLVADRLVEKVPVEGQTWARYKPTPRGIAAGRQLMVHAVAAHPDDTRRFYEMKQSVAEMSFARLLEDVYARYPEFATHSIFRRG
jgi:hypothetical protein